MESIKLDFVAKTITVGDVMYTDAATYLADHPDRAGDCAVFDHVPTRAVPQEVRALQGLLAIDAAGFAPAYEAWASDPARTFAERAFINRAETWRRTDPTLQTAAQHLGLSDTQLDDLFVLAAAC